ncbi:MAG: uroporphyrinogen decarboxylase [Pseudomonadota bacterium]
MTTSAPPILQALRGAPLDPPPLWLMRQAGRHLPEYLETRAKARDFMDFCFRPELAIEATLQPVRRYGMDAAILFSDILTIPHALGQEVVFEPGEGPVLGPLDAADLDPSAAADRVRDRLQPVFETVAGVRAQLPPEVALLGFAGAPWTLATYMLGGRGTAGREEAARVAYLEPAKFDAVIEALVPAISALLEAQIAAGAQAVQIFDSWAGDCPATLYERAIARPTARIVDAVRAAAPEAPIIGFPRGAGTWLARYRADTHVDAVGLDERANLDWAAEHVASAGPVQGAVDPLALIAGGEALDASIDAVKRAFRGKPYVFNLGHGVRPETPIPHVERLIARVRSG